MSADEVKPVAWIIEPKNGGPVYLTLKGEVAAKRLAAGDHVTAYISKRTAS